MDKMGVMEHLSAGVAHELKNPLNSIQAYVERLPDKILSPEFLDRFFDVVPGELDRLHVLLTDLTAYAKPMDRLQRDCVSLKDLIKDVVKLFKVNLMEEGVEVHVFCDEGCIHVDRNRIKQMLINLLMNAIEVSKPGDEIHITGRLDDLKVHMTISDEGQGLCPEDAEKVFTPFFTTKDHGTGLGLPVCKQIVEEHEGVIRFLSQEGVGSDVHVELPRRSCDFQ